MNAGEPLYGDLGARLLFTPASEPRSRGITSARLCRIGLLICVLMASHPGFLHALSVPLQECPATCTIRLERPVLVDGRSQEALVGRPRRAVENHRGDLILLSGRAGPPIVFDGSGRYVRLLGSQGQGPGETVYPSWIDASLDDSVRVFQNDRTVVFSPALQHVRTTSLPQPTLLRMVAPLRPGVHAVQSAQFDSPAIRVNPILVRRENGQILYRIDVPRLNGWPTRTAFTRDASNAERLWLVEYQPRSFKGYRVVHLTESGKRLGMLERRPEWWEKDPRTEPLTSAISPRFPTTPWSAIWDVRQVGPDLLGILAGTPTAAWRDVPFNPRTNEGYFNRFDTVLEIVDIRRDALVAAVRLNGSPISFVSDSAIATYAETSDGFPQVTIWRFKYP